MIRRPPFFYGWYLAGISFWIAAPRNADRLQAKMQGLSVSG